MSGRTGVHVQAMARVGTRALPLAAMFSVRLLLGSRGGA